jgi:hypothetical protein
MILATHGILASGGTITYDSDALAFITAAGITNNTQKSAVNQLVLDLKSYSLWSKIKAIYPFVGGTASSHKWNLKDPRDLDVAFRLTFNGGGTHSSNGYTGGSNAYANTFLNTNTIGMSVNSLSIGFYATTNISDTNKMYMGASGLPESYTFINTTRLAMNTLSISTWTGYKIGLLVGNRTNSTQQIYYRNGVVDATFSANSNINVNEPIFILTRSTPGAIPGLEYYNGNCGLAFISDGLSTTENLNMYNAVQLYETTLGREVI